MTPITPELKQAIIAAGDKPARLVDPESNTVYVLVKSDVYDNLREWLRPIAECYDDPAMDVYDEIEPDQVV